VSRAPGLWCLLAALLFGAATPASKVLLGTLGPITLAGLLYLGAAVAVLPFSVRHAWQGLRRDTMNLRRLIGAVILGGLVAPVLLLVGLTRAPAASVALWLNLEVAATTVLAWTIFREHLDIRAGVGVTMVLLAGALLALPSDAATASAAIAVLAACVCWGLDNNLTSRIDGFTPAQYTVIKGLVAGMWNLGLGLAIERPSLDSTPILAALGVGGVTYGASLVLYVAGAQEIGAARSQMLFAVSPFLGGLIAWSALGEPVEPLQLVAGAVMLAGVASLLSTRHAHLHTHEPAIHTHSHRHDDGHHAHGHAGEPRSARHTHPHAHDPQSHVHPHLPDLHHRHGHPAREGRFRRASTRA
jgi:drug/metabolite transporter (DMT)-like permease